MLLFLIIIDPHQKQISPIILESLHILLLPDLLNRTMRIFILLQFNHRRRFVPVQWSRNQADIRK